MTYREVSVSLPRPLVDEIYSLLEEEQKLLRYPAKASLRDYLQDVLIPEGLKAQYSAVQQAKAPHIIIPER